MLECDPETIDLAALKTPEDLLLEHSLQDMFDAVNANMTVSTYTQRALSRTNYSPESKAELGDLVARLDRNASGLKRKEFITLAFGGVVEAIGPNKNPKCSSKLEQCIEMVDRFRAEGRAPKWEDLLADNSLEREDLLSVLSDCAVRGASGKLFPKHAISRLVGLISSVPSGQRGELLTGYLQVSPLDGSYTPTERMTTSLLLLCVYPNKHESIDELEQDVSIRLAGKTSEDLFQ